MSFEQRPTAQAKAAVKQPVNKHFLKSAAALFCAFALASSMALGSATAWADTDANADAGVAAQSDSGTTGINAASAQSGATGSNSGATQSGSGTTTDTTPSVDPTPVPTPAKINLSKATVKLSKTSFTYTGKAQKPSVKYVKVNGKTLSAKTDYTATIAKGKKAGTYKVVVKAKGSSYTGSKTVTYTIKALAASKFQVTLSKTSYTYNGKAKKPKVTVKTKVNGKLVTLKKNRDYKVTYKNNVNAGKAKVVISGKGNFAGTKTVKFKIAKASGSKGSNAAMAKKADGYSSSTKYLILINSKSHKVGIYKGSKGNWKQIKLWSCTTGASSTPTVKGTFTVKGKGLHFGESKGYTCWYYTQFYGNYLFHSVLYYPNSKTKIKSGVLGVSASHGCVRLAKSNAKWIYDNIPRGTKVVSY